jgi:hypothetical protein
MLLARLRALVMVLWLVRMNEPPWLSGMGAGPPAGGGGGGGGPHKWGLWVSRGWVGGVSLEEVW